MAGTDQDLLRILQQTPLVSVDVLLFDPAGRVLLGWRRNRPAQHSWFVPGGRIRRGESLADAFRRICQREVGLALSLADASLHGAYEHMYDDNSLGAEGVGSHYVVVAYAYRLQEPVQVQPDDQHDELRWFTPADLLAHPDVHPYTKRYLQPGA